MGKVIYPRKGEMHTAPDPFASYNSVLNDNTWEQIRTVSDAGVASNLWSVGDRKGVDLNGVVGNLALSGTYYCYILGFDHNADIEGKNRIHFQFGYTALEGGVHIAFVDSGYGSYKTSGSYFNMNNTQSNIGGWESSLMRTVICPTFKSVMPSELQAVLKSVTKYSNNVGNVNYDPTNVTATIDEIFLLAEWEVLGEKWGALDTEQNYQMQYDYYKDGNSKLKYRHNSTSSTADWWLRSVHAGNSNYFRFIPSGNGSSYTYATYSCGIAPAFCV